MLTHIRRKKIRIALNVVAAVWIAAFAQIIVNEYLGEGNAFVEAFTTGSDEVVEGRLEITASYTATFLTAQEKDELLTYLASRIGLTEGYEIAEWKENGTRLTKKGSQAETTFSIIVDPVDNKQYIHLTLNLLKDPNQISYYKNKLEEGLGEVRADEWQTTMGLQSTYKGRLPMDVIEETALRTLQSLGATTINKREEENLYSVYAYSDAIEDAITVDGEKINVHIAARYQESEDVTILHYSTPIINQEF